METLTTYEVATGKRTKAVRKALKVACKPAEIDTFWKGGDKVTDKCRDSLDKSSTVLVGAGVVMGESNLLVVLHGDRLGELAILDPKSLTESKKSFHLPWCDASGSDAAPGAAKDSDDSAPAPPQSRYIFQAAHKPSSKKSAVSIKRAMRSRAVNRPFMLTGDGLCAAGFTDGLFFVSEAASTHGRVHWLFCLYPQRNVLFIIR